MPLNNFGLVGPQLARAAQPDAHGFGLLREMGFTIAVKLNEDCEFARAEEARLFQPGVVQEIPIPLLTEPDTSYLARIVAEIERMLAAGQRVVVHCSKGRDRTGVVIAAFRLLVDRWPYAEAIAEFEAYGVRPLFDPLYRAALHRLARETS